MAVKEYIGSIRPKLERIFPDSQVALEWDAFPDDEFGYAPKPDIAVGPLAREGRYELEFEKHIGNHREFFEKLIAEHNLNIDRYAKGKIESSTRELLASSNPDARCLMSVDIENETARKHILGTLVNAAALGKIAVLIGWDTEKLGVMFEQRRYLKYLSGANPVTPYTENVLILSPGQFEAVLDRFSVLD